MIIEYNINDWSSKKRKFLVIFLILRIPLGLMIIPLGLQTKSYGISVESLGT